MMPRLDGLQLVAALRGDMRTAEVPVLLLSARAGQEAAIEGLEAGADDYLVKPFSAAELLARVRANVELARLRSRHVQWRAALVDSLHEAFYLCDEDGSVVEINAAFTDILGYGPEGLPYPVPCPWWPDGTADPDGHRLAAETFRTLRQLGKGTFTVPFARRDGRRIWVTGSFNEVRDPDHGRRMVVGTFRDVTAEHYAVQREAALAAMGLVLSGPAARSRSCTRRSASCAGCGGRARSPPRPGPEPIRSRCCRREPPRPGPNCPPGCATRWPGCGSSPC